MANSAILDPYPQQESAMAGTLYIISAASGTGKTSLVQQLILQQSNLYLSISHTTRSPRAGEVDGESYHFVSVDTFRQKIESGDFIEYAEVFGNWYGTCRSEVHKFLSKDQDVLLEIDWQGAAQIKSLLPDAIGIFLLPPSRQSLEQRLKNRGKDRPEVIEKRLAQSVEDMRHYQKFDYLVLNDQFDQALAELKLITQCGRLRTACQEIRLTQTLKNLLDR